MMLQSGFTVILNDFNARSKSWWSDDSTSIEGTKLDSSANINGFNQLISEPTHILSNSLSYVDFTFTDKASLVVDSDVHPTVHEKCQHWVTCCKLSLRLNKATPSTHTHTHAGTHTHTRKIKCFGI